MSETTPLVCWLKPNMLVTVLGIDTPTSDAENNSMRESHTEPTNLMSGGSCDANMDI